MSFIATKVLSARTWTFAHAYVIRLPWWVLPAVVGAIAAVVAVAWFIVRRPRR